MKQIDLIKEADILFTLIDNGYQLCPNHFDLKKSKNNIINKLLKYKFIESKISICEFDIYHYIINIFEKFAFQINTYRQFGSFRIFLTRNKHYHKFTPRCQYLAVCIEFYDNHILRLRIKLAPYIGEFNCYEVCTGIFCDSPHYSWIFKKCNILFDLIGEKIPIINLNPATVYMYVLDSTLYNVSISHKSSQYNYDRVNLQKYCDDMNRYISDLNLVFNNDCFKFNKKYKLKKVSEETAGIINFPSISSFIYEHKHSHRI